MLRRPSVVYVALIAACGAVAIGSMLVGTCGESFFAAWQELALPRLLLSMISGAALAVAGAMFQALFRNPLASPYTLGVSSGASLGAALTIFTVGGGLWHGIPIVSVAAFGGGLICVMIVYTVAHLRQGRSIAMLLLAGVTIGFICSALIAMLLYLAQQHDLRHILQWMMGSLETVGFDPVYESAAMVALAMGVAIYLHRDLDLLMMGELVAASRGVSVKGSRRLIYFSASLMTAGVVAHSGPIVFVGLIVPHIMRFVVGPIHRHLLPACVLAGAAFLPLCDVLARNAMWWLREEPRQLPVGVLTSLVGGCFFLYLLLTRREERTLV